MIRATVPVRHSCPHARRVRAGSGERRRRGAGRQMSRGSRRPAGRTCRRRGRRHLHEAVGAQHDGALGDRRRSGLARGRHGRAPRARVPTPAARASGWACDRCSSSARTRPGSSDAGASRPTALRATRARCRRRSPRTGSRRRAQPRRPRPAARRRASRQSEEFLICTMSLPGASRFGVGVARSFSHGDRAPGAASRVGPADLDEVLDDGNGS